MDIFDVAKSLGDAVYLAEVEARRTERWQLLLSDEAQVMLADGVHVSYVRDLFPLPAVRVQSRLLRDVRAGVPYGALRGDRFMKYVHERWVARSLESPRFEHMPFAVSDRLYPAEVATLMGVDWQISYEGVCQRVSLMVAAVAGWLVLPDTSGLGVGDAEACARGLMVLDEITKFDEYPQEY